jgi:hypothetical protein
VKGKISEGFKYNSIISVNSNGIKLNSFNQSAEEFRVEERQDHLDKFPNEIHYLIVAGELLK